MSSVEGLSPPGHRACDELNVHGRQRLPDFRELSLSCYVTMSPNQHPGPDPHLIEEELTRILRSPQFGRAGRVAKTLRRIVDLALAGRHNEISEKTLDADLSDHPEAFTAVETSRIRTTILRLRRRLDAYYREEGRASRVRITIPKGSYVPAFAFAGLQWEGKPHPSPTLPRLSENLEARRLYLEGRLYLQREAGPKLQRAIKFFERAIELDPNFAAAFAGIADCYYLLAMMGMIRGNDALRAAAPLLDRAVKLDPDCGDAWASMGVIQGALAWRWKEAGDYFQMALELSPSVAGVLLKYSSFHLLPLRKFDAAQRLIGKALELQPNVPRVGLHYAVVAYCRGDLEEARAQCLQTLEFVPRSESLLLWLGRISCALEDYEQAQAHFLAASRLNYTRHLVGYIGYCHARLGREDEARRVLEKLLHWRRPGFVPDYILATLHLGLGDMEKCLDHLEAGVESRCPWMPLLLTVDPLFTQVRLETRAVDLLRKMNLPLSA